jgi:hypothetical protein
MLARQGKYNDCLFHRLVPGFMVCISSALSFSTNNVGQVQTGDPTGTGTGGQSYWGTPFRDEYDLKGAARHDSRGVVAMANKGANTNGSVLPACPCVRRHLRLFADRSSILHSSLPPILIRSTRFLANLWAVRMFWIHSKSCRAKKGPSGQ